jgi:uncharacterized membrane protein YhaH (DUF805 family)
MFQPLRKYADFTGRARRKEFWLFWLFLIGIEVAFSILISIASGSMGEMDFMTMNGPGKAMFGLYGLVMLALIVPSLAVSIRRLHDTNRTAWWILLALIPFLGALVLIVFYVLDGTPGPNKYGEDPKGRVAVSAAAA